MATNTLRTGNQVETGGSRFPRGFHLAGQLVIFVATQFPNKGMGHSTPLGNLTVAEARIGCEEVQDGVALERFADLGFLRSHLPFPWRQVRIIESSLAIPCPAMNETSFDRPAQQLGRLVLRYSSFEGGVDQRGLTLGRFRNKGGCKRFAVPILFHQLIGFGLFFRSPSRMFALERVRIEREVGRPNRKLPAKAEGIDGGPGADGRFKHHAAGLFMRTKNDMRISRPALAAGTGADVSHGLAGLVPFAGMMDQHERAAQMVGE